MGTRIYRTTVNGKTTTRKVVSRSAGADDLANFGGAVVKVMLGTLFAFWPILIPVRVLNVVLTVIWAPFALGIIIVAAYPQVGEWLDRKSGRRAKPATPQSPRRAK